MDGQINGMNVNGEEKGRHVRGVEEWMDGRREGWMTRRKEGGGMVGW